MNRKILALLLFVVLMIALLAAVFAGGGKPVQADDSMKLPGVFVQMRVVDGASSYFQITLSRVMESNLWVANGSYIGWCADHETPMPRDTNIDIFLYSSIDPPNFEFSGINLKNQQWDMVNYILNHKHGGNRIDVQHALWHFVNVSGSFELNLSPTSLAIIEDAEANGNGFTPAPGQIVAVLTVPRTLERKTAQLALIEIPMRG